MKHKWFYLAQFVCAGMVLIIDSRYSCRLGGKEVRTCNHSVAAVVTLVLN